MHRIWEKRPLRCASELVNAFMLVGLYCHRYGLESDNSFQDSISALLTIVSTAMTKTVLSEYGWHSLVNDSERIQVGNYQCLLGSMIAHSCEPNVEWSFDGQYFRVKALRYVLCGVFDCSAVMHLLCQAHRGERGNSHQLRREQGCTLCQATATFGQFHGGLLLCQVHARGETNVRRPMPQL